MGRTIALIPARGGSKGLPGKNIRPLSGKPLMQYSIEAALKCRLIDAVYVSTDDPAISALAEQAGAQMAPLRPAELATDTASTLDVVRHFLDWHDANHDPAETLVLLQPTSPLRSTAHLTEALTQYLALPKPASLVSVTPAKPLGWQGTVAENGQFRFYRQPDDNARRQSEAANYSLNGAIYCTSPARFAAGQLLAAPLFPYVMPPEASVDIDTIQDFKIAEFLFQNG